MKEYLKFLPSYFKFVGCGFTDEDILKAMSQIRMTKEDIVCVKEVEQLSTYYPYVVLKDNHSFTVEKKIWNNKLGRYEKIATKVIGYKIETPYNLIIETKLIHKLFSNRYNWFNNNIFTRVVEKKFKTTDYLRLKDIPDELEDWKVSELISQDEISYFTKESKFKTYRGEEIYLETDIELNGHFQCLYIPIKAILNKDWSLIEKRHTDYHKEYYKKNPESLIIALSVLESPESLKLKTILNGEL